MNENLTTPPLLSIQNLTIALPKGGDRPYAVQDVSYDIRAGEILCIVVESGSGKPMGANATGHESGSPSSVVERSMWRTSTSTFWRIARRSRLRRLRRIVVSVSEPPAPKFHTSRGSRARAARRISGSVTNFGPGAGVVMAKATIR